MSPNIKRHRKTQPLESGDTMIDWPTVGAIVLVLVFLVLLQRAWAWRQLQKWKVINNKAVSLLHHITPKHGGEYKGIGAHQFTDREREEIALLREKLRKEHLDDGFCTDGNDSGTTGFTPGGVSWTPKP